MRRPGLVAMAAVLGFGLAANALLGPLMAGVIDYWYGASMINQATGLDAVALLVGFPLALVAGWLTYRGRAARPVLALGPATVVSDHRRSWILFGLAAFITLGRQLPAIAQVARDPSANLAYRDNPTAFWLVAFLDLAIVTPAAIAAGIGLRRGIAWARTAAYTVMGWFALVRLSVAAINLAMRMNDDPLATTADAVILSIAALVFTAAAAALYRPLFVSTDSVSATDGR